VLTAYHVWGKSINEVKRKIIQYVLTHLLSLHNDIKKANEDWKAEKHKEVGTRGGQELKKIFPKAMLGDDSEILQHTFNGFWEEAKQPDPQHVVECFDPNSATLTVELIGKLLEALAANKISTAQQLIEEYGKKLPEAVKTCLNQSSEVQAVLTAYHIWGIPANQVKNTIIKYVILHFISLHNDIKKANNDWKAAEHKEVGTRGGQELKKIFKQAILGDDSEYYTNDQIRNIERNYAILFQEVFGI